MAFEPLGSFVLVGGTALALQLGHRISEDIDMFTRAGFDEDILLNIIQEHFRFQLNMNKKGIRTLNLIIDGVKTDLLCYNYPVIDDLIIEDGIRMMGKKDIAAMKLSAISSRGEKKDFYDLYFLLHYFTLQEMLGFYQQKFSIANTFHVIKSLDYFMDAESSKDVEMLHRIEWKEVKKYITERKNEFAR
jgi:hypothetical protein